MYVCMYESETSNLGTERCSKLERKILYGHAENNRNWDCIFWYFFERRFVADYCVFVTEFRVFTPEHRFELRYLYEQCAITMMSAPEAFRHTL